MQVPIVFCADGNYGRYLPVAVQSIIENSSLEHEYHIIIFDCGIKAEDLAVLERQIAKYSNFSLQVENITTFLNEHKKAFIERYYWSAATYGRFFISKLCSDYKKIIYADIDMIFNRDVAGLMAIDLGENYIAAVVDPEFAWKRANNKKDKTYISEVLGLADDEEYINAGLLIFNIPLWEKENLGQQAIQLLETKTLEILDQDAINIVCKGRILHLSAVWNCLSMNQGGCRYLKRQQSLTPLWTDWQTADASEDIIFHYNNYIKPWHDANSDRASLWWHHARNVGTYEQLLQACVSNEARLNLKKETVSYRFFGLKVAEVKVFPRHKKYYLFGLQIGKIVDAIKKPERDIYLFGIKFFSRRNAV